jgi:hypothetical protein
MLFEQPGTAQEVLRRKQDEADAGGDFDMATELAAGAAYWASATLTATGRMKHESRTPGPIAGIVFVVSFDHEFAL